MPNRMVEECVRVCLCFPIPLFLIVDPPHFSIIVGMLSTELVWRSLFVASIPTTWPHNASHNAFLINEYFKYLIKAWKYIYWQSVLKYHRSFQFWVLRFFLSAYFRWDFNHRFSMTITAKNSSPTSKNYNLLRQCKSYNTFGI